jgi:hypothetical protein
MEERLAASHSRLGGSGGHLLVCSLKGAIAFISLTSAFVRDDFMLGTCLPAGREF